MGMGKDCQGRVYYMFVICNMYIPGEELVNVHNTFLLLLLVSGIELMNLSLPGRRLCC